MGGECLLRLNPLLAGREGTSAAFPKFESYAPQSGARPTKEAESPESSNHRRMFTGFRARLRFASAPRNDKFHGIAGLESHPARGAGAARKARVAYHMRCRLLA